jgi:hypothetical protein
LRTNDAPYELSQLDTAQRTVLFEQLAERDPSAAANLRETLATRQMARGASW